MWPTFLIFVPFTRRNPSDWIVLSLTCYSSPTLWHFLKRSKAVPMGQGWWVIQSPIAFQGVHWLDTIQGWLIFFHSNLKEGLLYKRDLAYGHSLSPAPELTLNSHQIVVVWVYLLLLWGVVSNISLTNTFCELLHPHSSLVQGRKGARGGIILFCHPI